MRCFSGEWISSELTLQSPGESIKLLDPTPRGSGSVD